MAALGLAARAELEIERKPLKIGTGWEFGQVIKGTDRFDVEIEVNAAPFNRLGVAMMQELVANNRFEMRMGVGGLFWNPFPNRSSAAFTVNTRFGPGITQATGIYHFGRIEKRNLYLQFGFFPFKYNRDAHNLGEYLFRSGCYPGIIWTGGPGGWTLVNAAGYIGQGLLMHWDMLDGMISHDFTLFFERDYAPMFDLTPSYLINFNLGGVFEFGAGVSLHHYLPMKPSLLTPKVEDNTYLSFSDFPASEGEITGEANSSVVLETVSIDWPGGHREGMYFDLEPYEDASGNSVLKTRIWNDTRGGPAVLAESQPEMFYINVLTGKLVIKDSVPIGTANESIWLNKQTGTLMVESAVPDPAGVSYAPVSGLNLYEKTETPRYTDEGYLYPRETHYFTYKGIKLMGKAAFDPKPLLGETGIFGREDLRLYAEFGVLGLQDQPLFYTDITKRIPVMFGFNLPAFKILDLLSLQFEYYGSDWPTNSRHLQYTQVPLPYLKEGNVETYNPTYEDNWHWSLLARKQFAYGNIFLQVARDYLRTITYDVHPTYSPIVDVPGEWYYTVRLEFGL
jgi:hypothetical protein